jgi:hypothetical protein
MLLTILMRNKYPSYIINEIISMVGLLRYFVYTYKYKKIITLI